MTERTWRHLANARTGLVELDLDKSNDAAPQVYALTLTSPNIELRFMISSLDVTKALSVFMEENYGRKVSAELVIGALDSLTVRIFKDDEHADRFFITAAGDGMIEVTVVDPIARDLARAIKELSADAATKPL